MWTGLEKIRLDGPLRWLIVKVLYKPEFDPCNSLIEDQLLKVESYPLTSTRLVMICMPELTHFIYTHTNNNNNK